MKTAHTTKQTVTIGLDLGDRRHTVCVLSDSGQILAEETLTNTHESLTGLSVRYPQATIVMETGTHSPWVSRLFTKRGHTGIIVGMGVVRRAERAQT